MGKQQWLALRKFMKSVEKMGVSSPSHSSMKRFFARFA